MNDTNQIVSEADVGKALDWLRDNAQDIGDAKAAVIEAGHMVKHTLAIEMRKTEGSAALQEREARASDLYVGACFNEAKAAGVYEHMRALREAAALKIEVWRTESANYRSMKIG
jgi:hypothetical protein